MPLEEKTVVPISFPRGSLKLFRWAGAHFSKNLIHVSREISQFTFHISLIENCAWTSLTSYFSNHISYYFMYIFCFISCILLFIMCEMGNVKWDSHFTFLRCQMWFVKQTWNENYIFGKMGSSPGDTMLPEPSFDMQQIHIRYLCLRILF